MSQPTKFLLCSTFHDPQFRLKYLIKSALSLIKKFFSNSIICCTHFTSEDVLAFLSHEGINVIINSSKKRVDTYKQALETTLDYLDDNLTQKIFYIDFNLTQ